MGPKKLISLLLTFVIGLVLLRILPLGLDWIKAGIASMVVVTIQLFSDLSLVNSSPASNEANGRLPTLRGEMRLAASLQEAIIIINGQQKMIHINPAAHELFPNARTGSSVATLTPDDVIEDLTQNVLSGRRVEPLVYQIHDPVERHIRVTASTLKTTIEDSAARRAIIVFYDVTDLERANAMRADFLANASHELKTPVASLLGYIETLNGHAKNDPEARTKFLGIMQQQAERMQRLINDILSLRRIELSEHKAPTETADLYLAVIAAREAVTPMADAKDIQLLYIGPKALLVKGTQDELVQLVLNIIDNAIKISPPGSEVRLNADLIHDWQAELAFSGTPLSDSSARRRIVSPPQTGIAYAQLRIRDAGPGFSKDHMPRLSERFYRIAGDRNSQEKGTGLGLAIVKHIVMRHRGGLMIETAQKIGTEFTILIPVSHKDGTPDTLHDADKDQVLLNFTNLS